MKQKAWPRLLKKPDLPLPKTPREERFIATGGDWTVSMLEAFDRALARHASNHGLSTYPIQYEIITADQMIDLVSTTGMPIHYPHWSFGKRLVSQERLYRKGATGLAYEIVINTNPSLVYLMETNTLPLQVLVMAHAGYGHNAFFKNNYLFRQFTQADGILDYLKFASMFIRDCEERYGWTEVESLLDSCHALAPYGVDRYRKPPKLSARRERERLRERIAFADRHRNPDHVFIEQQEGALNTDLKKSDPEENLLYFIEKNAPKLAPWQREIVRIVRKVAQYFYPQRLTKVANEGAATFWHYTLLHDLYDAGEVDDGFMIEWLANHSDVVFQPGFDHRRYFGINPYALGFAIFRDIRRIAETPTDEDREWFPDIAGKDWRTAIHFAMANFKDESLIEQYLSPKVIRDMRLFLILDDPEKNSKEYQVTAIHNEAGYRKVRAALAAQYRLDTYIPTIVAVRDDESKGSDDRALRLRHLVQSGRMLDGESVAKVFEFIKHLWHFDVVLEEVDSDGNRLKVHRT